jgi:NTE family protein
LSEQPASRPRIAVVLSGGGARGAYEAGVLNYVRSALPQPQCGQRFDLICGSSVGALNAALLAATAEQPLTQGRLLCELWSRIEQDRIFRRDWLAVGHFLLQVGAGLVSNFLRFDPSQRWLQRRSRFVSLFDTSPMPAYLRSLIELPRIGSNLDAGHLDALAITATNLDTDQPELFLQRRPGVTYSGDFRVHDVKLGIEHLLASAAIPFAFPPVKLNGTYYCDGGVRLNTPLSPAIQLGAERILAIGTHALLEKRLPPPKGIDEYPSPGRLIAAVTEAIFSDKVRSDIDQLQRINRIIEWAQAVCSPEFLPALNRYVQERGEKGDLASRGLKQINALLIRPSQDIGQIFEEQLRRNPYLDPSFSTFERFILRLFALDPREARELLSYLMFAPRYLQALTELGFKDARSHHAELVTLLAGGSLPSAFPQLVAAPA